MRNVPQCKAKKNGPFQIKDYLLGVPFQIIKNGKSCCVGFFVQFACTGSIIGLLSAVSKGVNVLTVAPRR